MANASRANPRRRPRRARRALWALAGFVLALLLVTGAAAAWLYVPQPSQGPQVVVAVDESAWNALGLNRLTYVRRLRQQGLRTHLLSRDTPPDEARERLAGAAGLVLTGGGDVDPRRYGGDPAIGLAVKPWRDALEFGLLAEAEARDLPVLALCRGAQLLNVHRGGTLGDHRSNESRYREHRNLLAGHPVTLAEGSRLRRIYGTERLERVTTWHGQFVDQVGSGLRVTARAPDGTPEAVEDTVVPGPDERAPFGLIGVQWHAEMPPWDARQRPLFAAFADAARHASR